MLRLRPYKACDAKIIVSWIKDEVVFRKWCADRFEKYPITEEDMNAQYSSLAYADNFFQMTAFDETPLFSIPSLILYVNCMKKISDFAESSFL